MNIHEYKKAAQEIHVNTDKIKYRFEKTLYRKSKDKNKFNLANVKKPLLMCIASFILIFIIISANLLTGGNASNFSITVYASDVNNEFILSDTPITLTTSNQFNMQGITNNEIGTINFNLNLKCEGDNIESITYKLSDKIISINNRGGAVAWFAENDSYIISSSSKSIKDESVYESYSYDNKCFVTKMIGNAYSVDYDNQNNKNYALVISLYKNNKGDFIAKDFTITVIISLNNGTSLKRYILVHPIIGDVSNYKTPVDLPKIQMTLKH